MCGDTKGTIILNSNFNQEENKNNIIYETINHNFNRSIGVSSYKFNYEIPNINPYNNTCILDTGAQSYPVTLDEGIYNRSSLAVEIQNKFNLLGLGAFNVVYDANTQKYTITAPVAIQFKNNVITGNNKDFIYMIGIKKEEPLNSVLTSFYNVNLHYTECIYVTSKTLNKSRDKNEYNNNNVIDNILTVYLDLDKNSIIQRVENIRYININQSSNIDKIDIVLYDDQGRLLYGNSYNYIIEFYTV